MATYFNPRKALIQTKNWETFYCDCCRQAEDGRVQCSCGENIDTYNWHWEKQMENNVILSLNDREVLFHPVYSTGTAAVKGIEPFKINCHHYWEIKVLTSLYGTDISAETTPSGISKVLWWYSAKFHAYVKGSHHALTYSVLLAE